MPGHLTPLSLSTFGRGNKGLGTLYAMWCAEGNITKYNNNYAKDIYQRKRNSI